MMCIRHRPYKYATTYYSSFGNVILTFIPPLFHLLHCFRSVSYTHLDVYKRQVVRQFGLSLSWAYEICVALTLVREDRVGQTSGLPVVPRSTFPPQNGQIQSICFPALTTCIMLTNFVVSTFFELQFLSLIHI